MDNEHYSVKAEVHTQIKLPGGEETAYRLKVSIPEIGLYINGFTARESSRNDSGWWVQAPARKEGRIYKHDIEFNTKKALWQSIEERCIEAIKEALIIEDVDNFSNEDMMATMDKMYPDAL